MNEINVIKAPVAYTPKQAGYVPENLDKIDHHLKRLIKDKIIFAAAYLLSKGDKVFTHRAMGKLRFDREKNQYKPDTIRYIASITKVFTGILLADMVRRGEVELFEPIAKLLPPEASVPTRNGKSITLVDIATHHSGLPFMPPRNPVKPNTLRRIYEFITGYELPHDQ